MSIFPASMYLGKIALDIWRRVDKRLRITKVLNHRILALEDLWKVPTILGGALGASMMDDGDSEAQDDFSTKLYRNL
jgi:hypothetical protein